MSAPSGEQHEIAHGDQRATIVEVGGGVRAYRDGERDVLDPYPVEAICDGAHGTPLIPWPNRLADGRYTFDGTDYQVALTEPEKTNAIHGFLRWRPWGAVERNADRVVMAARINPAPGYPSALDLTIDYSLGEDGLTVTTTATNVGERACPFGSGQHPYLSPGGGPIDDCTVQLEGETRILTDPERQLPTGREPVEGTEFDFRSPRPLGEQAVDFAFTDLTRDSEGRAWMRLTGRDSRTAELWVDEAYPFLEMYTGDTLAPDRRRQGLGAEPMTCAPNAFQSGEGLLRLEPGSSTSSRWGVRLA